MNKITIAIIISAAAVAACNNDSPVAESPKADIDVGYRLGALD
jgi:hypothetical protein